MQTILRITVLQALLCLPALIFAQDNPAAPVVKAQLQARLTGTDVEGKLEVLAEVERHLLSLSALDKPQQEAWLPLLIGLLQDEDGGVRYLTQEILWKLARKFDEPVRDRLVAILPGAQTMTQCLAAEILIDMQDPRVIKTLLHFWDTGRQL
jgi:HEAT repeat protein